MDNITLTKENLKAVLIDAFNKGEAWGNTYTGWFIPTGTQNRNQVMEMLKDAERKLDYERNAK